MATPAHVMIRAIISSQAMGELNVRIKSSKMVLWMLRGGGAATVSLVWLLIGAETLDLEFAGNCDSLQAFQKCKKSCVSIETSV